MKKNLKPIKMYALMALLIFSKNLTFAQITDVGSFLSGGANDAGKILGAYIKPFSNAFGYNLNAGWYNTAKVHSLLGFDLTLTFNVALIPAADKTFDVSTLGLSSKANISSPSVAQTIAGKTNQGPEVRYITNINNNNYTLIAYNTPGGVNLGFIPIPMVQAGLGLIKGTEIIGRFMPTVSMGKGGGTKIGLWGIGLKHSLKQWIPAVDEIPFLNISVLAGYSRLHMVSGISLDPTSQIYSLNNVFFSDTAQNMDFSTQKLDLMVKSFTANALASLDFPFITLYAGIGISSTSTDLKMLGNYAVPQQYNIAKSRVDVSAKDIKTDPISIALKGGTKPRLNIGLKLKLGLIALHADYTYANYSIATVGLGVGFR
jgi:hypothetical protein